MCVSVVTWILFFPQALCDVILETVFPATAMFLLPDAISDYNIAQLSLLRSGTAHLDFLNGVLLAGSMAEGLTRQLVWGHPAPDADLMALLGSMWGVTITGKVAPGSLHGIESALSSAETSLLFLIEYISSFFSHSTQQMKSIDMFKNIISSINKDGISKLLPLLNMVLDEASINTLRPRPNRRHVADDIFKWIFLNKNAWILIKVSLKFVPKGPIDNIPALVQIMAWRRPGDKPLSGLMRVSLLTHICVTRPQWVKALTFLALQKNKSCLEYAPGGCPLAYTRLRGINVEELPTIYTEFFEEENGHHRLRTNHLNEQIQQYYNMVATYPATPASTSGPAGQVRSHGK